MPVVDCFNYTEQVEAGVLRVMASSSKNWGAEVNKAKMLPDSTRVLNPPVPKYLEYQVSRGYSNAG